MQNWKSIAHEAKDLLTVCLAKAVDQAMTAQAGPDWFTEFAQADALMKMNLRITKPGQMTVQDMDLQALLKLLRFRSGLTHQVLTYHGFFRGLDTIAKDAQMGQLNQLLDRLMVDFRNRIEAHSRAADIEQEISGNGLNRIYGYEEAVQDMLRLARLFPTVCDAKGVSYCHHIESLTKPKKKTRWLPIVAILSTIAVVIGAVVGGILWWINHNDATQPKENVYYDDSDPQYKRNAVTVQPILVYYEGDSLVMDCYINNGTDTDIADLDFHYVALQRSGNTLATHNFGLLDLPAEGITLEAKDSITWRFVFRKNTVLVQGATLSDLEVEIEYTSKALV